MTLDELLKITEDLKQEIEEFSWDKDDVRHSFFALLYSGLYDYYIGQVAYEISFQIGQGKVSFASDIIDLKPHVVRLYEIGKNDRLTFMYQSTLNRSVVYGSWTAFEMCLSLIFDQVITEQGYEDIIKKLNSKLIKLMSQLDPKLQDQLIVHLRKSSFIPLVRKFNYLTSLNAGCYQGDLKEDRKFIDLMTTVRNCMIHTNGLYYGSPKSFVFHGVTFDFEDGKVFKQVGNNDFVSFEMALELKRIFKSLSNCLNHIELIEYPEDQISS